MLEMKLLEIAEEVSFKKQDHIYHPYDDIEYCYFIKSGLIKVYIDHENGRRSTLDFIKSGDWLGELSIFYKEEFIKENMVLKEVEALRFSITALKDLCLKEADISYYFASYISKKLLDRTYRMSHDLNYSLESRLAMFILNYSEKGIYHIAHTDAAEYLNISYRHILFVFKQLIDDNVLIKVHPQTYEIVDKLKLESISVNAH